MRSSTSTVNYLDTINLQHICICSIAVQKTKYYYRDMLLFFARMPKGVEIHEHL